MSAETLQQEIYDELRALAAHRMRGQRQGHTLQATALVHEVFLKMAGAGPQAIRDRNHFFAVASLAMHQVLIQHARQPWSEGRALDLAEQTGAVAELVGAHAQVVEQAQVQVVERRVPCVAHVTARLQLA